MPKAAYKLPNVFVGCPYGAPFDFAGFRGGLALLPFKFFYANTSLKTKHILSILRSYIRAADFCIFDISLWNPNVALEIGLADGLNAKYYILLHSSYSEGVPADIQGLQRIQYASYDPFDATDGLIPKLIEYLVKPLTHPHNVWNRLEGENRERRYYLALRILAHFRDHQRLTSADLQELSKGTYLRAQDRVQVMQALGELDLLASLNHAKGARLKKRLFKDDIRIR